MSLITWLHQVIGPANAHFDFLFYIFAASVLLICIDGILGFIFGAISHIFKGG